MTHGLLLVDKPEGITSNAVVGILRRRLGRSVKVGHTGTLDPQASGLLVILIGAATRALDFLDETKKRYLVTVRLGEESDTCDREGPITFKADPQGLKLEDIEKCLEDFRGCIEQEPPHFSAIKKNGVPLYKLARKGVFPVIELRKVEIFDLSVINWRSPDLEIDLTCSKGTYARSIARDIGAKLGVGGRVETLRRVGSGKFDVVASYGLDFIKEAAIEDIKKAMIPLSRALEHIPELETTGNDVRKLFMGGYVTVEDPVLEKNNYATGNQSEIFRVEDNSCQIFILVRLEAKDTAKVLKPIRVFSLVDNLHVESLMKE